MVGSVVLTTRVGDRKLKGDEHGYFAFGGSTVLLLFRQGSVRFDDDLLYNTSKSMETLIRMGESIGRVNANTGSGSGRLGSRTVGEVVGVTKSTINPLSAQKLEQNEAVLQEEKRGRRASMVVSEEKSESDGEVEAEGEAEEVADGSELFTVGDLSVEEVREVRDVLMTVGDL